MGHNVKITKKTRQALSMLLLTALMISMCPVNGQPGQIYSLHVKPNRCIALHKGQVCYQKLKFKWKLSQDDDFCLYQTSKEDPILCWSGSEKSQLEYQFESTTSESFQIRRKNTEDSVAEVKVTLSWVYRTGRKNSSGWRLF